MYVIRVKPSDTCGTGWLVEDNRAVPSFLTEGGVYETTGKIHATTYRTKAEATERAILIAMRVPDYMGKLTVQWVPACGS